MENEQPKRKKNRLKNFNYNSCGAYFLIICTSDRKNYFWDSHHDITDNTQDTPLSYFGNLLNEAILNIPIIYPSLSVEYYVIMPDHVHLLVMIHADEYGNPLPSPTISRVVKQLKASTSKQIGFSIWQKSFYDHIIRNQQDYEDHIKYIFENPIRKNHDPKAYYFARNK